MNCQYCGKRLALLRRLNKGQFCTPEHRDAYQAEQQVLAVQRLLDARWPDKKPAAKADPSFIALAEEEFLPEPPSPQMSGRELPVFLNVSQVPRRLDNYSLCFESNIRAIIAPILPEALGLKDGYAKANRQIPLIDSISSANLPVRAKSAPHAAPDVQNICRPESRLVIEGRKSPARIGSRVKAGCLLSIQAWDMAAGLGMIQEARLSAATPQMPRLRGQTKWLPAVTESQSDLPMGTSVAVVAFQVYDLTAKTESPEALSASFGVSLPSSSPYSAKDRIPPRHGKIGWAEPIFPWRFQLMSEACDFFSFLERPRFSDVRRDLVFEKEGRLVRAAVMPDARPPGDSIAVAAELTALPAANATWVNIPGFVRQATKDWVPDQGGRILSSDPVSKASQGGVASQQVHSESFAAGNALLQPRLLQPKPVVLPGQFGPLNPASVMPGIRPPSLMDKTGSIQPIQPAGAFPAQLAPSPGGVKTTFELNGAVNLHKLAPYALSHAMERAAPIGFAPEEFHTWLDVPLFEVGPPAKCGVFANLQGPVGLDRILANPRTAATGKWDDLLPSFCGLTPLLLHSKLKTIRPLSLTRKGQGAEDLEKKLRNELSSKFTVRGVQLWGMPRLGGKWVALGLTIAVAIVFLAISQRKHPPAEKTESRSTQQDAQIGVPISIPIKQAAARTEPANRRPAPVVAELQEPNPESTALTPIRSFFDRRITNLKLNLAERAHINLTDDFRSGFTAWEGAGDWARSWTYDRIGLLRPGQLALYQPSMGLNDYTFEFSASAGHGSIGWVFRAGDLKNYYGMRLQMSRSGAGTQASLERWIVAGGRERPRKFIPVRMPAWEGDISRIKVAVEGSSFITSVNGQIADIWADTQFESGGIGFFNEKGGDARIHKMSVSHQTDMLGKLCAMLTPHDLILRQQGGKERKFR